MKSININGWPIIAKDVTNNVQWDLRISTNAFAFWSIGLVLNSIINLLINSPEGDFKKLVLAFYINENKMLLFEKCLKKIDQLTLKVF